MADGCDWERREQIWGQRPSPDLEFVFLDGEMSMDDGFDLDDGTWVRDARWDVQRPKLSWRGDPSTTLSDWTIILKSEESDTPPIPSRNLTVLPRLPPVVVETGELRCNKCKAVMQLIPPGERPPSYKARQTCDVCGRRNLAEGARNFMHCPECPYDVCEKCPGTNTRTKGHLVEWYGWMCLGPAVQARPGNTPKLTCVLRKRSQRSQRGR